MGGFGGHGGPDGMGGRGGNGRPDGMGGFGQDMGEIPSDGNGETFTDMTEGFSFDMGADGTEAISAGMEEMPAESAEEGTGRGFDNADVAENSAGDELDVGTPDAGTTQAAGSSTNSNNYSSYEEMLAAYEADILAIEEGDAFGKNIVDLYNPLNYIGAEDTDHPAWMRIVCGAVEGDIAMFNSLNMQIAALNAGIDTVIEWQWDGGHVPGEVLGNSLALWVDTMYGEYVSGVETVKAEAEQVTENGTAESATGTDLSGWVSIDEAGTVSFSMADGIAYRTSGASKAVPGFDVIDYGQEDYVFGDSDTDARHWSKWVLKALQDNHEELEPLFK
jgi:hypothetical protein